LSKIIYAVRSKTVGKIKIGEARLHRLFTRVRSHQSSSADELELLGVHYGQFTADKDIHPILGQSHSHLEWFNETNEVSTFISKHFFLFPEPMSVISDVSWAMDKTVSIETIAIQEYIAGRLSKYDIEEWFKSYNLLDYL
jgi:hypothetical protein